jgi:hypothetical protein
MNLTIIDQKDLGEKKWYLCKCNLKEYILSLNEDMFNYEIQRGIVVNKYLDGILSTIKQKEPIPLITLTSNETIIVADNMFSLTSFDILDGLQRTYRLWLFYKTYEIAQKIASTDLFQEKIIDSKLLLRELKALDLLNPNILSVSQVRYLSQPDSEVTINEIDKLYSDYEIYFNIWSGLDSNEVIKKMLILNVGQKSVTVDHQYELIYLNLFKGRDFGVKVVRYKESNYQLIKSGKRIIGEYLFSSIIISLKSFIERKPQRLSIEFLSPSELEAQLTLSVAEKYFSESFIQNYLNQIKSLEQKIFDKEGDPSLKWFVKDTTMSGILAAVGNSMPENVDNISLDKLILWTTTSFEKLNQQLDTKSFCINEFFKEYDNLASTRINIGDVVRKAIFNYTIDLISGKQTTWNDVFKPYTR